MLARRIFFGLAALFLAALVFIAGYAAYPLLHQGALLGLPAPGAGATAADAQMAKYWQVWDLLERDFYGEKPTTEQRTDGAIAGMVQAFGDPYTFFVEPQSRELERDQLAGKFGGIGANLQQTAEGYLLSPLAGQPAAAAGILEGDLLLAVDGQTVDAAMHVDDLLALIRGPVGSPVTLLVRRAGEEMNFTVTRAEIQTPSIEWRLLDDAPASADVGYLRQTIFSERSPAEMEQAVASLREQGAVRFVWDLRGNPGGLLSSAVAQADMWLDKGVIVVEERAGGLRKTFEATGGELAAGAPLVLLVDGGSASASEIVAGALHDHSRAQLVGQQTFGKGSVQLIHELADQSSLHVTNAQWYTAGGQQISGQGLAPDIVVAEGDDPLTVALGALPSVQEAKMRNPVP
jgi:carboxyl-terminal processing protease